MTDRDFITGHTALQAPEAVPELQLWLASEVTPLWQATESWLAAQNCAPPYWAFAWAGGQALARYLFDDPETVRGRRVFDLASGSGIAAIAAARCGAAQVTANEIDRLALAAIAMNGAANDVKPGIYQGDAAGQALLAYDVILAGDICYERAMTERLVPWLRELAKAGKTVLLADPGRTYLPKTGLEELTTYLIPTSFDLENCTERRTTLYRLLA